MSSYYSSGSDHYYHYGHDLFSGYMIITFGTFICLLLIVIMIVVCCICCRVKKPKTRILVHPVDQLQRGTVGYVTNHDQVQYIPSANVQQTQQQQSSLPATFHNRYGATYQADPAYTSQLKAAYL